MKKRCFVILGSTAAAGLVFVLSLVILTIGSRPQTASADNLPNFVVILVDDLD